MTWYMTSSNTTTSSTQYYTVSYNYGNYSNTTASYRTKSKQEYKNKEVKYLLQKERGW